MKVMMLGWEYPPIISGGLATACEGLTHALSARGVDIDFVLPKRSGREEAPHMSLYSCNELKEAGSPAPRAGASAPSESSGAGDPAIFNALTAALYFSSYARPRADMTSGAHGSKGAHFRSALPPEWLNREPADLVRELVSSHTSPEDAFLNDPLFREVSRYTREVAETSRDRKFDLVHAHDWMTFPAAILLAKERGVPFVAHIHSLEYDRCGDGGNRLIQAIESLGARCADRVIAVSHYTRRLIAEKLGVDPSRISVAHNGVKQNEDDGLVLKTPAPKKQKMRPKPPREVAQETAPTVPAKDTRKRVLFLGRVTFQKGPDYFVEMAKLVLAHHSDVVFVVAGTGDMLPHVKDRVAALGLSKHFEFPGFISGSALDKEFRRAEIYVMPSVSEPFGIAPLEALARGTPALISKQSGVSEVLSHALKADFWDVRKMADYVLCALDNPELGRSMMAMSRNEIRRLRWDRAASDVTAAYGEVLARQRPGLSTSRPKSRPPRAEAV